MCIFVDIDDEMDLDDGRLKQFFTRFKWSTRLENLISDLKSFAVKFVHGGVLILSDIERLMDFARHKIDSSSSEPKFLSKGEGEEDRVTWI